MPFHENLRTLRLARGLTQPLLAEKAGIEQSYLSKLENGRSKPSEDVLVRLAQALEVKLETLQQDGDEMEERRRVWVRAGLSAAAVGGLAAMFLLGRATAIYPLSLGQVISGAAAADDMTQQIVKLAPAGVEVIMLSRNGPTGNRISIVGAAPDEAGVDAYMDAIRKRFGGSFMTIHVSPPQSGRLQDFQLEFLLAGTH